MVILFAGCEIKTEPAILTICPEGRVKSRLVFFLARHTTLAFVSKRKVFLVSSIT
jgi:hypothetical protein